jgi:membrane protein
MNRATETLTLEREHSSAISRPATGQQYSHELDFQPGKGGSLGVQRVGSWAKRVYSKILADNCFGQAAQLAYYFLFALFPFLLFLTTLLAYIPVPELLDQIMHLLARALPGEALSLVQDHIHTLVNQQRSGLLSFGIIVAVWTASSAILAITEGLNRAYSVEESRPWWKVRGMAMLLVVGLSLFMIVATVLLIFGPQLGSWLANGVGLGDIFTLTWNIARWPVSIVLLMFGLALLYYFAPNAKQSWRWISPGSVVAVIGWIITSLGFSFYVTNFASYNATYGSIGTVIVLLTWLYFTGVFILIGGEVNAAFDYAAGEGKLQAETRGPAQ